MSKDRCVCDLEFGHDPGCEDDPVVKLAKENADLKAKVERLRDFIEEKISCPSWCRAEGHTECSKCRLIDSVLKVKRTGRNK